jgi:hypothetical protein
MMRWAGCVTSMGEEKIRTEFWWGNLKGRDHINTKAYIVRVNEWDVCELDLSYLG